MAFGKPMDPGQSLGRKNPADCLKWRDCAVGIPESNPVNGLRLYLTAKP